MFNLPKNPEKILKAIRYVSISLNNFKENHQLYRFETKNTTFLSKFFVTYNVFFNYYLKTELQDFFEKKEFESPNFATAKKNFLQRTPDFLVQVFQKIQKRGQRQTIEENLVNRKMNGILLELSFFLSPKCSTEDPCFEEDGTCFERDLYDSLFYNENLLLTNLILKEKGEFLELFEYLRKNKIKLKHSLSNLENQHLINKISKKLFLLMEILYLRAVFIETSLKLDGFQNSLFACFELLLVFDIELCSLIELFKTFVYEYNSVLKEENL